MVDGYDVEERWKKKTVQNGDCQYNEMLTASRLANPETPINPTPSDNTTNPQPNPNPNTKRRVRLRVVGTIMSAAGPNMWNVSFDFDEKIAVHSRSVKIVPDGTAIPVYELVNNNNGK